MHKFRLSNPFTPKTLASGDGQFFGRSHEIESLQDNLRLGHIAIHGPVGIGKSSLLAQIRRLMQGEVDAKHRCAVVHGVCSKDIKDSNDAAGAILSALPQQTQSESEFSIGPAFLRWVQKSKPVTAETPMITLRRFVMEAAPPQVEYMIFAFDQAENCPSALTSLVRTLTTDLELRGCHKLRLILSGVSPYFDRVTDGDTGLNRVFTQIRVLPLHPNEARELVETKLQSVVSVSQKQGIDVHVNPNIPEGVVRLSGGHPHIIQLLGSYLIQHENANPDDMIDVKDLGGAVRRICYEDRGDIYTKIIENLETVDMIRPLSSLLSIAECRYPTLISRKQAQEVVGAEAVEEFIKRDILVRDEHGKLRLVDEFLNLRLSLDQDSESGSGNRLSYSEEYIEQLFVEDPENDFDEEDD